MSGPGRKFDGIRELGDLGQVFRDLTTLSCTSHTPYDGIFELRLPSVHVIKVSRPSTQSTHALQRRAAISRRKNRRSTSHSRSPSATAGSSSFGGQRRLLGAGFAQSFRKFTVHFDPLHIGNGWHFVKLALGDDYAATVAMRGNELPVVVRDAPPLMARRISRY